MDRERSRRPGEAARRREAGDGVRTVAGPARGEASRRQAAQGFGGGAVLEVVEDHDRDTYRAVYTVRYRDAVYLLHAFQKKSKRGIRTPKADIDLIRSRLKLAEDDYRERQKRKERGT